MAWWFNPKGDCALQPKVAPTFRGYLGYMSGNGNNANGVVAEVIARAHGMAATALRLGLIGTMTQGGSFLATLGFETESRWDSWTAHFPARN